MMPDRTIAGAAGWHALSPRRAWCSPSRPSLRSGRATQLIVSWGALALLLLAGSLGCADSSITRANSSEAISRAAGSGAGKVAAEGAKPATDDKPATDESTTEVKQAVAVEEPAVSSAKGRARNISFDTIKFEMEKRDRFVKTMLTPTINALDKKRVKIRGFMLPSHLNAGIARFILVRDNQECCFGPGAALFDAVAVEMRKGETTKYEYFPITVDGVFHIDPIENPLYGEGPLENSHLYIFRMDDAVVSKR